MNTSGQRARVQQFERVWANRSGWRALSAVNHSTIGFRFMVTGMVFFLIGGVLAMLIRTQLAQPEQNIITAEIYAQAFTMHGTVMMFLFAIPALEGLAMYVVPKMLGARDLVFPRLSALGYYCYLFGGIIVVSSIVLGIAPDAGWFMYTPLSSATYSPGPGSDFWLLGITFVEISAISAGVELAVSILRARTEGMSLRTMPIFCWYILGMAMMIIFGFPPLILASILLELERAAGWVFFDVAGGGDPLLWQHLFWLFGHPEVYILFLPAAGIVSTLVPVFSGRPVLGYRWLVLSIILTGFISFGLWVHHMFTVGIPALAQAFFSVASMLVAIPTAIQVFVWLGTMWLGKVRYSLPMLWIFGFLFTFVCGGLTGVMIALVPFDWQVHDTHFIVAHLHYVTVGGVFFPLMAGFYYWLPHFSGRMPSEKLGRWGFWLFFGGFNLTFLLMHLTGLLGMPRRVYTYEAGLGWDWLNLLSSIGGFIMAVGVASIIMDYVLSFRFGRKAKPNPWNADTLEWAMPTPPPNYNFASQPAVNSRHPLWDNPALAESIAKGEHALADAKHGLRETLGTDALTGKVTMRIHLPDNSWIPLQGGLALGVLCLGLLTKYYLVALLAFLVAAYILLRWSWHNGAHPAAAPCAMPSSPLLLHSRTKDGPGLWGMAITLLANGTLFLSLLFGWLYLWMVAPEWSIPEKSPLPVWMLLASGAALTVAAVVYMRAIPALEKGHVAAAGSAFLGSVGLGVLHVMQLIGALAKASLTPTASAHDSLLLVLLCYQLFHSVLAVILTCMQRQRVRLGYVTAEISGEPHVLRLWWIYTLGIFWFSFAAFILLPQAWGLS